MSPPSSLRPFAEPIFVTRPLLPPLEEFTELLGQIWNSKWLTNNGAQHALLESRLRETLGVPHLSLFNNGTVALITAIQSLGLSGEVITTPFTFPATAHVLKWNNLTPVFCDIADSDLNIDCDRIEAMITPRTTGILAVHVYGAPCNVRKIQSIADRHRLKVIYDAAHAFGAAIDGVGIGNFGDITMFSFHATKLFHTAEGGALAMRNAQSKTIIDLLKNFGIKNEDEVLMPGINGKMNELQAALGLAVLGHVETEKRNRAVVIELYRRLLEKIPGITIHGGSISLASSLQYFVIRVNAEVFGCSRDELQAKLRSFNVHARKYFYPLCSDYDCYRELPSAAAANLPVAGAIVKEVLCLPLYGELPSSHVERICEMISSIGLSARSGHA